jgi:murein L,D-transpeptidase YafK
LEKVSKDYRKPYKIFLILFLLSFGTNLFVLALYFKNRVGSLSQSLIPSPPSTEVKETRRVRDPQETKVFEAKDTQKAKGSQETKVPQGMVPLSFVHVTNKNYFLLCEKQSRTLSLYRSEEDAFPLVKSYPCIVGSNNVDKKQAGDLATPEGIYFLTSYLAEKSLSEKYGAGAFSLNYPNFLDQKEGKKGSGIWLHGHPDHLERPPFSEGCVVVKNEILKELAGFIKVGDTPIVIVDTIKYQPQENQQRFVQDLSHFLDDWKKAWESRDPDKYLSFYSKDFVSSDGKNYQKFKEYKRRVNLAKRFIQLQIERKAFLLSQKDGGRIAILRVNQDYRSDSFKSFSRKILYLREEQGKWKIIGDIPL